MEGLLIALTLAYVAATIVAGMVTKHKNFGFITGVVFSFFFTPFITILIFGMGTPAEEKEFFFQEW